MISRSKSRAEHLRRNILEERRNVVQNIGNVVLKIR